MLLTVYHVNRTLHTFVLQATARLHMVILTCASTEENVFTIRLSLTHADGRL